MLLILTIIFGAIGSFLGPWWIVIPICMALCYWQASSGKQAFFISAAGILLLWIGYSAWLHFTSQVDLVQPLAQLFLNSEALLPSYQANGLIFSIVALIAGLIGGFGGLAGYQVQKLIRTAQ